MRSRQKSSAGRSPSCAARALAISGATNWVTNFAVTLTFLPLLNAVGLGWVQNYLLLQDVAVVVRHPDGSFTLDRERFPAAFNVLGCSAVGFLAGLVLGVPLVGAAIGAVVGGAGTTRVMASAGIGGDFVREVQELMKPATSAVFLLDSEGDMEIILHGIRGLGGTVLKTNVDVERARLIQSTLSAPSAQITKADGQ